MTHNTKLILLHMNCKHNTKYITFIKHLKNLENNEMFENIYISHKY